mgnify:CR=1 FL=1
MLDLLHANGNGARIQLPIQIEEKVFAPPEDDKVKDYGHNVLELGMLYMYLLELVNTPDR